MKDLCLIALLLPDFFIEGGQIVFCDPHVLKYAPVLENVFPCQKTKYSIIQRSL